MWRFIIVLLVWALATAGCGDEDAPVPEFNVGMSVGDTGRTLVPTVVPSMKDQTSLLGAAASAEEVAQARPMSGGEAAANVVKIQIDASTPEGLMQGFIAIIESGNVAQLADILVPEQQEAARELLAPMGDLIPAIKALDAKWKEKFPDSPLPGMAAGGPGLNLMMVPKLAGIEAKGDAEAEATLEAPEGSDQPAEKITLKRIDDAWRVELPQAKLPSDPEMVQTLTGMFGGITKVAREFVSRLENNEFATPDDAKTALDEGAKEVMAPLMAKLMEGMSKAMQGGMNEPAPPPAEGGQPPAPETLEPSQPSNAPANEPAGERPKSQLEQDMDNAAGRAGMGGI